MTDYKTMYAILCKGLSSAVDKLNSSMVKTQQTYEATQILKQALDEAENVYIDTCDRTED